MMKQTCIKCETVNVHGVVYYGRVIEVEQRSSVGGTCIAVTKRIPNIDELLRVTCGCCGYEHIEAVGTKTFNDEWDF